MARKHTPLMSQSERGLYGAAYGAKKAGKPKPSYVPESIWGLSLEVLAMHLQESAGKDLPKHVRKKKRLMEA